MLTLDHIAISTEALETGAIDLEDKLGVPLSKGGQHAAMGTWNRLLSLGPGEYLELIAIEPGAPAPPQQRWFDLDNFAGVTRSTTWICRCDDLDAALAAAPEGAGVAWDLARADLRWRMAIPQNGLLPFSGLFPALIEWTAPAHPADRLEDRGVRLTGLRLVSPQAEALAAALAPLVRDDRIEVLHGETPRMEAILSTPNGEIRL
ncbi:hypothetical protein roselon_00311 [Roseibacterium elongatum DSM 19469]|uniref:Glyoxalase-like domain-containing protein n=1 Tax=Roseicyclus elongatus DSM 19469 TaxID=1294273 RepID=W8RNN4_9RHOB|nr:VOC family protein [Roseibacterium elongatum]AHM02764.1 hypothetical protein roselon_00311 [Roseibacterium elongatum DSM 19469]